MDLDERARIATVDLRESLGDRNIELGLQQIHQRMRRRRSVRIVQTAAACSVAIAMVTGLLWFRADTRSDGKVIEPARPCAVSPDPVVTRLMVGGSTVSVERVSGELVLIVDGRSISSTSPTASGGLRFEAQVQGTTVVWGFAATRPTYATVQSTDGTVNPLTVAYLPDGGAVFIGPVTGSPNLSTLALSGNSLAPVCR